MARSDIKAGKAFVELYVKDNAFVKGLSGASRKLSEFGRAVGQLGTTMQTIGKHTLVFGGAVAGGLSAAVLAASKLQETMNKFDVVFGESSEAARKWADEFGDAVGRSQNQVRSFLANTQDLLVPLGFAADAASGMSKEITTLAVDLASFNNMSDADVIRDLHAALTGSGEVMKKYGVIVSEAAVKQEMLNSGMDPKAATDQQKVQARMAIIMRGTTAAQGDAIRSAGSFENQMKALKATLEDTGAAIGTVLLPIVTEWVTKAREVVTMVADWVAENPKLIKQIAMMVVKVIAAAAAIAALGYAITTTITLVSGATTIIGLLISLLTNPVGFVLFASVGAAAFAMRDQLGGAFGDIKDSWGGMLEALKAGDLEGAFEILSITIQTIWSKMWANMKLKAEEFWVNSANYTLSFVGLGNDKGANARLAAARHEVNNIEELANARRREVLSKVAARNAAKAATEAVGEDPFTKAKRYMDELRDPAVAKKLDTRGPIASGFSANALDRAAAGPQEKMLAELRKAAGIEAQLLKVTKQVWDVLRDRLKLPEFT